MLKKSISFIVFMFIIFGYLAPAFAFNTTIPTQYNSFPGLGTCK